MNAIYFLGEKILNSEHLYKYRQEYVMLAVSISHISLRLIGMYMDNRIENEDFGTDHDPKDVKMIRFVRKKIPYHFYRLFSVAVPDNISIMLPLMIIICNQEPTEKNKMFYFIFSTVLFSDCVALDSARGLTAWLFNQIPYKVQKTTGIDLFYQLERAGIFPRDYHRQISITDLD